MKIICPLQASQHQLQIVEQSVKCQLLGLSKHDGNKAQTKFNVDNTSESGEIKTCMKGEPLLC